MPSLGEEGLTGDPVVAWIKRHCAWSYADDEACSAMLENVGIFLDERGHLVRPIDPEQLCLLCLNIASLADDEFHALTKQRLPVGTFATGARIMLGFSHLEDALKQMMRFFEMFHGGFRWKLEAVGEVASLSVQIDAAGMTDSLPAEEVLIVAFHMCLCWYAGRTVPLLWLSTVCRDHPALIDDRRYFIRSYAKLDSVTAIHFPRSCLGWPVRARNSERPISDAIRFSLGNVWNEDSASFLPKDSVATAALVRSILADDPTSSVETISSRLDMSPMSLWRALRREGVNFQQLRRSCLSDLAVARLQYGIAHTEDVAEDLGFSDARSFRRFMRSATGFSPAQIRAGMGATSSESGREHRLNHLMATVRRFDAC
ncbi:hypothetical protein ASE00_05220 [Sphingomonas sp. Root710]|uniref:helix-turn-helix transcriptional regulator n=1 Tax=Sphingomonas sp. Root710 TaxID=1736594 RepID=UPI0006FA96C2|nr:AraC family transcriptional regulator [Sphingomonas sp. Root710]KRB86138.1 hypothetical protein ASE00_05220 [Sphingomonas sp. Root710]